MISIGVDLSFTGTGLVCLQDGKIKLQHEIKTEFESKNVKIRLQRIKKISKNIQDFIKTSIEDLGKNYIPEIIVIEGYSFASRSGMAVSIGELGGLVREMLSTIPKHFIEIPPSQLKKFITGKGNCEKNLMLLKTFKMFNEEFDNNNICDAFGLAKIGECCIDKTIELTTSVQKDIIEYVIKENNIC